MAGNVKLSRYGVCYTLEDSPFESRRNGWRFKFSSQKHKDRFDELAHVREDWLIDSLSRRFGVVFDAALLADLQLYSQVEKRGYLVYDGDGKEYGCSREIRLSGMPIGNGDCTTSSARTIDGLIG